MEPAPPPLTQPTLLPVPALPMSMEPALTALTDPFTEPPIMQRPIMQNALPASMEPAFPMITDSFTEPAPLLTQIHAPQIMQNSLTQNNLSTHATPPVTPLPTQKMRTPDWVKQNTVLVQSYSPYHVKSDAQTPATSEENRKGRKQKAERASAESGRWLFVAGHHSSCISANSFMHYESPALLANAYLQTTEVINKFSVMVQALLTLEKQEVIKFNDAFIEASQQKEIAQKEASRAREELASKVSENAAYQSLILGLMNGTVSLVDVPNLLTSVTHF
ncbi:hypothetical protein DXG01_003734 [Tephrocybe rancida]|nr:hypothetical protein DXG01_003734 [Tephrocybe rancida]